MNNRPESYRYAMNCLFCDYYKTTKIEIHRYKYSCIKHSFSFSYEYESLNKVCDDFKNSDDED